MDRALQLALQAVQFEPTLPLAHANALKFCGRLAESIAAFESASELNPNVTDWRFVPPLVFSGQFERAI